MKRFFQLGLLLTLCVTMSACSCYKKMAKKRSDVTAICTPEVLALNNGEVPVELTLEFPAKYFNKKALVRVTPVLVHKMGEVTAEPFYLQGTKISENYKTVDFAAGAKVEEKFSFKYAPELRRSKLQLRVEVLCKCGDCGEFVLINPATAAPITMTQMEMLESDPTSVESLKLLRYCGIDIANGVNTLQADINYAAMMGRVADNYKRVTTTIEKTDIKYNISSSVVNRDALRNDAIAAFEEVAAKNAGDERTKQSLVASGYASPDGPEKFNDRLAQARSKSAQSAVASLLSEYGLTIDAMAYGEDWDGFKELVEASDIADKGLILQVLGMYDSSTEREEQIKNLSSVFEEIKVDILPELRRAQIKNLIEVTGKSDEEMMEIIKSKEYDSLNLEESLYAAAKFKLKTNERVAILESAAKRFESAAAYNNLGVIYANNKGYKKALSAFEKALDMGYKGEEINRNLALAYAAVGNVDEAKKLSSGLNATSKGAIAASEGNYIAMTKGATKGYNAAIAYTQLGNYPAAKSALGKLASADADYLRAIIASKEGDMKSAADNLAKAIKKNKALAKKAETDVNLINLYESGYLL